MQLIIFFFFQAEDGIRDLVRSRGLGDVYKETALEDKFDAVKIVRAGSEVIGGKGGGGRADFAQAGGTLPDKIDESFENIKKLIN